jgi:hypothetical protein
MTVVFKLERIVTPTFAIAEDRKVFTDTFPALLVCRRYTPDIHRTEFERSDAPGN